MEELDGSGRSGRFPVGALAPGMVYSQPIDHQHPASFLVSLNGAQHYLSFPVPIAPPTDLSKSSSK
ncbi:unnamed protein product [Nesidiocoris tenuis]|uniref:Uncharacterized protein n=1 Tax=Nesidiocoris tenuis TaxID=355587 RepID=A0A6H5HJ87_9HEMI|nr:unnamed protein product [Nesidiocoris tenuis]